MEATTNHAYIGVRSDGANYRAVCKCGHVTQPALTKNTVIHRLIDHKAKATARDERKAKAERSKRGKHAYAVRKRNEQLARKEVSA